MVVGVFFRAVGAALVAPPAAMVYSLCTKRNAVEALPLLETKAKVIAEAGAEKAGFFNLIWNKTRLFFTGGFAQLGQPLAVVKNNLGSYVAGKGGIAGANIETSKIITGNLRQIFNKGGYGHFFAGLGEAGLGLRGGTMLFASVALPAIAVGVGLTQAWKSYWKYDNASKGFDAGEPAKNKYCHLTLSLSGLGMFAGGAMFFIPGLNVLGGALALGSTVVAAGGHVWRKASSGMHMFSHPYHTFPTPINKVAAKFLGDETHYYAS